MPSLADLVERDHLAPALAALLHDNAADRSIVRRLAGADRFIEDAEACDVPAHLIEPLTHRGFVALDREARRAVILGRVRALSRAQRRTRRVRAKALAGAPAPVIAMPAALRATARPIAIATAPTPAEPLPAWTPRVFGAVVACACNCGELFPARGPRPLLRFCEASTAARRPRATSEPEKHPGSVEP